MSKAWPRSVEQAAREYRPSRGSSASLPTTRSSNRNSSIRASTPQSSDPQASTDQAPTAPLPTTQPLTDQQFDSAYVEAYSKEQPKSRSQGRYASGPRREDTDAEDTARGDRLVDFSEVNSHPGKLIRLPQQAPATQEASSSTKPLSNQDSELVATLENDEAPVVVVDNNPATGLLDLPTELQMKIFEYVLQEKNDVEVDIIIRHNGQPREVIRKGSSRKSKLKQWRFDEEKGEWFTTLVPRKSALLCVSKEISAIAMQVLYKCNTFGFTSTTTMATWLEIIGTRGQWIRSVKIQRGGYVKSTVRKALRMLKIAQGLKNVQISHFDLCVFGGIAVATIAKDCQDLLEALRDSYEKTQTKHSVFDVIKISLPDCVHFLHRKDGDHERAHDHSGDYANDGLCRCPCSKASKNNDEMQQKLKAAIVKRLVPLEQRD